MLYLLRSLLLCYRKTHPRSRIVWKIARMKKLVCWFLGHNVTEINDEIFGAVIKSVLMCCRCGKLIKRLK